MKKIIAMVGTSIFENYMEEHDDQSFRNYITDLKDKSANEYNNERNRCNYLKNKINEWFGKKNDKINISAEIKSLVKLKEELKDNLEIYFLTSDTILSNLAAEIIEQKQSNFNELKDCKFNKKLIITDLQIKDRDKFNSGMANLINEIYKIVEEYRQNIIINITAGYKATLPYLTILAQVNKCPIYYIFEDTDALIKIPYIPLSINWEVFKENESFFYDLEVNEIQKIPENIKFKDEIESLIEKADNLITLNPLGITLWEKYKEKYDIFKISKRVKEYMKNSNKDRKKIIDKSFSELKRRLKYNPQDPDLNHSLSGITLPSGFKTFKHKENNLQVRILYYFQDRQTRYKSIEKDIYIGLIAIGTEVHNAESEYVKDFNNNKSRIENFEDYENYRIEKEVQYVS